MGGDFLHTVVDDSSDQIVSDLAAVGFAEVEEIARGGLSVVYRCREIALGREVAVKILTATGSDDRQRFIREQRALGRLTGHPNIVEALQVGSTATGLPFLVMPYFRQGCLRVGPPGTALPVDKVLQVGVKIAGALESAHRWDVTHRDVKPANILMTDYGEPALSDFGIAQVVDSFRTVSGAFSGTPAFTAPEIIDGEPAGPASDIYSLGATLFALLAGEAPFARRDGEQLVSLLARIARQNAPQLVERGIDAELSAIVARSMDRNPDRRLTAVELGEALQRMQSQHSFAVDTMVIIERNPGFRLARAERAEVTSDLLFNTIPRTVTHFVGRQRELADLAVRLQQSRLVTVVGVGGVGKTTLVLKAAEVYHDDFPGHIAWVDFSGVRDLPLISVVAESLGIHDQPGRSLAEVVTDSLNHAGPSLVILDNCEHVIEEAATLVSTILRGCPELQVLATSREALNIEGEAVSPLAPMEYPEESFDLTITAAQSYEAVELLVQSARSVVSDFALSALNTPAAVSICSQLDGLPLAIELAAAKLRVLTPQQVADGLSDRFRLLRGRRRMASPRQKTLLGCIEWSYDLCTTHEQQSWAQLSVFHGRFGLDAVRSIIEPNSSPSSVLATLGNLVEKSILTRVERNGEVSFCMLDSIREFGHTRLSLQPELLRSAQHRHAQWFQHLCATARTEWFGPRQPVWIERLNNDMPNIRAALQFALAHDPTTALQMANNLRPLWFTAGMLTEATEWFTAGLSATTTQPSPTRTRALAEAATVAGMLGDLQSAREWIEEARAALGEVQDADVYVLTSSVAGYISFLSGETEEAMSGLQIGMSAGSNLELQNAAMFTSGMVAVMTGEIDSAVRWLERSRAHAEGHGESVQCARAANALAILRWLEGDSEQAYHLLLDALALSRDVNDRLNISGCLESLAWIAESRSDPPRATILLAAATKIRIAIGISELNFPAQEMLHGQCHNRAHEQLGNQQFIQLWHQGIQLSLDQAIAIALEKPTE